MASMGRTAAPDVVATLALERDLVHDSGLAREVGLVVRRQVGD